jgi:hypothetical protein
MMIPLRSNMNIHTFDQLTGNIFVSFYWINNTSTIFLCSYSFFVMCENTLDEEKKDVFCSILLIALWHHWSTTMTTGNLSIIYLSWGTNVHWHRRVTTGVRSQMNTDTLNWKCDYLESKYMNIISEKNK